MKSTTISDEQAMIEFVRKVAADFEKHPEHHSYGELGQGNYLALRWGLGEDCVLVLKQDDYFIPVNYQQAVKKP